MRLRIAASARPKLPATSRPARRNVACTRLCLRKSARCRAMPFPAPWPVRIAPAATQPSWRRSSCSAYTSARRGGFRASAGLPLRAAYSRPAARNDRGRCSRCRGIRAHHHRPWLRAGARQVGAPGVAHAAAKCRARLHGRRARRPRGHHGAARRAAPSTSPLRGQVSDHETPPEAGWLLAEMGRVSAIAWYSRRRGSTAA